MQNVYPAGLELDAGAILSRHCWVDRVGEMFTHQSLVSFLVSFFKALCPWTLAKRTHPDYPTRMTQKLKIQNRATSWLRPLYELIQNCLVLPFSRSAYRENSIRPESEFSWSNKTTTTIPTGSGFCGICGDPDVVALPLLSSERPIPEIRWSKIQNFLILLLCLRRAYRKLVLDLHLKSADPNSINSDTRPNHFNWTTCLLGHGARCPLN